MDEEEVRGAETVGGIARQHRLAIDVRTADSRIKVEGNRVSGFNDGLLDKESCGDGASDVARWRDGRDGARGHSGYRRWSGDGFAAVSGVEEEAMAEVHGEAAEAVTRVRGRNELLEVDEIVEFEVSGLG